MQKRPQETMQHFREDIEKIDEPRGDVRNFGGGTWRLGESVPRWRAEERTCVAL